MANLKKFTRAQIGAMLAHYNRSREDGSRVRHGNESIDPTKTDLNYNLHDRGDSLTDRQFIEHRTTALGALKRKDVNVMATWVLTLPEGLKTASEATQRRFFEEAYAFMLKRYGAENIVSAQVHMDETSPHLHFAFIPVVYDRNKKIFKVSAKEALDRGELRRFHPDLSEYMRKAFGRDVGILTNYGVGKNDKPHTKTIAELKQANQELSDKNMLLSMTRDSLQHEVQGLQTQVEELREQAGLLKRLQAEIEALRGFMRSLTFNTGKTALEAYETFRKRTARSRDDEAR